MGPERLAPDASIDEVAIAAILAAPQPRGKETLRRRRRPRSDPSILWTESAPRPPEKSWIGHSALPSPSQQLPFNTCVSHSLCRLLEMLARQSGSQFGFDAEMFHQCVLELDCRLPSQTISDAVKAAKEIGVPRDLSGFKPFDPCPAISPPLFKAGRAGRIESDEEVKQTIAMQAPVIAKMAAESRFANVTDFSIYRDGPGEQTLVHAVLLVGYDDDAGCWIIQNSFGTGWGAGGYGRIAYGHCRILSERFFSAFALEL